MRSGQLTALPTSERHTAEKGSGFWPTLDASNMNSTESVESFMARQAVLKEKHKNGNGAGMPLAVAVRLWPTARSTDGAKGGPGQVNGRGQVDSLPGAVNLWATPRASPNENRQTKPTPSQLAGKHGMNLATEVNLWPTPQVADGRVVTPNGSPFTSLQKCMGGGMLNPEWDEQLMGWPTGWTGLPPEVIGRIKKARRRLRGKHLARAARAILDASKE